MGRLIYDSTAASFDIDDRLLAHFRVVAMNKLRRGESFMLQIPTPNGGHASLFISPSIPLVLQFFGGRQPQLDIELVEKMMHVASSPDGLLLSERMV
ncbi:ATP-dependent DNA ligase [Microbacterium sp. 1P10AE]|uniref:DUF7882 family protein n=1 Tax=Microbacterium sp. 1P10AE TaxID=3132286 RepID=UPI0039A0D02A